MATLDEPNQMFENVVLSPFDFYLLKLYKGR